jgi:hypothetical protein
MVQHIITACKDIQLGCLILLLQPAAASQGSHLFHYTPFPGVQPVGQEHGGSHSSFVQYL